MGATVRTRPSTRLVVIQIGEMRSATITLAVEGSFNGAGEQRNRDELVENVKTVSGASQYDFEPGVSYYIGNGWTVAGSIPCSRTSWLLRTW